jgi:hypothetical protein
MRDDGRISQRHSQQLNKTQRIRTTDKRIQPTVRHPHAHFSAGPAGVILLSTARKDIVSSCAIEIGRTSCIMVEFGLKQRHNICIFAWYWLPSCERLTLFIRSAGLANVLRAWSAQVIARRLNPSPSKVHRGGFSLLVAVRR